MINHPLTKQILRIHGLVLCLLLPVSGITQTLDITGGVQSYVTLTNTVVNLSGQCELHLRATNNQVWADNNYVPLLNPMPGCVINLNSPDAWLFLDNTRPSIVLSTYLSQINVNGFPADTSSNVRVQEYGMGSMVIPLGPSFQPLQVFTGSQFSGSFSNMDLYTFYQAASNNIPFGGNIGSFILKRGYMATIGRQSDSRFGNCYVAQDGDLFVGSLPVPINGHVGYIRVFPWNAPSKKGWAGGNDPNGSLRVDPLWNYDWNNGPVSTDSVEYSPMKWSAGWPGFSGAYNKVGSTHYLGYNEPNSSSQANMTVDQAIGQWPYLMQSGLRLVSPAPTDGGKSWLYQFMDKIRTNGIGLRCDATAIHMYMCGQTSSSLQSWLLDIHNKTHRKVWVTEFNNGANWTTCADPTYDQNASVIQSFISMMDSASFMERYAIYNWVEDCRSMINSNNIITPAGTNYLKEYSPRAYVQEYPAGAGPDASYLFEGDALDRTGSGNNGLLVGSPAVDVGHDGQALVLDGVNDYVQLPAGVGVSSNFTFAAWVNWNGGSNWQRIFDIGFDTSAYMFLTPKSGGNTLRFAIKGASIAEQNINATALTPGVWTHVAVTLNGTTCKLFVNGALAGSGTITNVNPSQMDVIYSYLGKSQFSADPLYAGKLDDVFFAGYALTDTQVATLSRAVPTLPVFANDPLVKADATLYQVYSGSIAADATGSGLTFSKVDGPAWLQVAADGTLSGTPGLADLGANIFHVRAVNNAGASAVTRLAVTVTAPAQTLARYSFEGNTSDSIGSADGVLAGTAVYGPGQFGQALAFDGTNNYVRLPNGVGNLSSFTIAAWVNWSGGGNWQRIFDFGNGQGQYMFLTPQSGSSTLRFGIKNTGAEQIVETTALSIGQWNHVALTYDGATASLYVNGAFAASSAITIRPSDFEPMLNYLGKSQFSDPPFQGSLDEFNIYNYALSASQVVDLMNDVVPPATPAGLTATAASSTQVNLSWSASSGATSYNVKRATTSGGPYTTITNVTATSYTDTGLVSGTTYYYVMSALNTSGESANSVQASATPSAGLAPYSVDANTLALFHFDEASGGSVTTNVGSLAKRGYSVNLTTASTTPPTVTTVLGAAAFTNFGKAASFASGQLIGWDANNGGAYNGDNGTTLSADAIAMTTLNMGNAGQMPWTIEALIYPSATNANQEIICTDSSATSRGFQFRINSAGKLELNLIATGPDIQTAIPSTGTHAYVANTWFHVAATYDGTNIKLYWTRTGASVTGANLISTTAAAVGTAFGAVSGPLCVGGENRAANGEYFHGRIDEVRISNVARTVTGGFYW